jgi:hypothetical protein
MGEQEWLVERFEEQRGRALIWLDDKRGGSGESGAGAYAFGVGVVVNQLSVHLTPEPTAR